MTAPLMPRATAVWLVENTTLTFRQIAEFCELHELEIQAIADGDVAFNILGVSPVENGQLTVEEIRRCEADRRASLQANELERNVKAKNAKAKKMLSPSQRSDKPSAVLWILKIVRKSSIRRFANWSEPPSRRLKQSVPARIRIWPISGLKSGSRRSLHGKGFGQCHQHFQGSCRQKGKNGQGQGKKGKRTQG